MYLWPQKFNVYIIGGLGGVILRSVADPDPGPLDPHVFGPPGSGSGPLVRYMDPSNIKQNSKKTLDFYCIVTFFNFFSLKYDVKVHSKSNMQVHFILQALISTHKPYFFLS
jgi:hypothetical protein